MLTRCRQALADRRKPLAVSHPPKISSAMPPSSPREKRTHYRWVVCALLFVATTIVYVDRQVFGILGPRLTEEFGWSEKNFSFIMSAFTLAYAVGYSLVGRIMDAIGERKGFLLVFGVWSVAEIAHCLVNPLVYRGLPWLDAAFAGTFLGSLTPALVSVAGFSVARFSSGSGRRRPFPRGHQNRRPMEPQARTGAGHRHLQQRQQRRRHRRHYFGAADRHNPALELGRRILPDRLVEPRLGRALVAALPSSRESPQSLARGIGLYPQRPGRPARCNSLAEPAGLSPNLGVRVRHVPGLAGVVVLHRLGAEVPGEQLWNHQRKGDDLAADRHLPHGRPGQHWRRRRSPRG